MSGDTLNELAEFKYVVHPNWLLESHPGHAIFKAMVDRGEAVISSPSWFTGQIGMAQ